MTGQEETKAKFEHVTDIVEMELVDEMSNRIPFALFIWHENKAYYYSNGSSRPLIVQGIETMIGNWRRDKEI
jgi:hypothetical protein